MTTAAGSTTIATRLAVTEFFDVTVGFVVLDATMRSIK